MKVIGLCGGSGSGKGTVCEILSSFGLPIIDTDAIYHELTSKQSECLEALRREFGDVIIKNGALHRPTLANIVFASDNANERRAKLNEISHFYVIEEIRKALSFYKTEGASACIVDIPLLFESGFDKECDVTVAVIADREKRLERIISRDKISKEAAKQRINSQISDERLVALADMHIINSGDVSDLKDEVRRLIKKLNFNVKG